MSDETKPSPDENLSADSNRPQPPPDGGFRAWFHVFLCHMVFFNTWGVTNSYGVFQQYYTGALESSNSSIAWIGGIQMFLLLFGGVVSGRASDAGYFRYCLCAGVALQVLGFLLVSFATRYYQMILSHGVCVGLGNGLIFTPAISVTSSYFKTHKSIAMGISSAGAATGGMVYPSIVQALLMNSNIGYGWTMRVVALAVLCSHIPSLVGYRPFLRGRRRGPLVDLDAFRDWPFVFFTTAMFLHFWGLYMAFFYLGTFARETLHLQDTFSLIIVLNGVGVVGRIGANLIAQKTVGVLNITIVYSVVCAVCIYSWPAICNVAGLYVWVVIYGIFAGGMQSLFPTLATALAYEPNKIGTWTGMALAIVGFSTLTAASIQGALIQADGGRYLSAEMFSASSIVLGCIFLFLMRWRRIGNLLCAKV